jgi:ParB-like chromosome segregation protein Spo0J
MGWRDHLPVHPAADLFPLMSESELRELGEDIKVNGLQSPITVVCENIRLNDFKLLDGRNRLDAMELIGVDFKIKRGWKQKDNKTVYLQFSDKEVGCPDRACTYVAVLDEKEALEFVVSANIHRRHLTSEQKRELIAKIFKAKPGASNRNIAKQTKADDKTVAAVRRDLESTAKIPQLEKTTGADGKQRKSRAKKKTREILKAITEGRAGDACLITMAERASKSAEISPDQRKAEHAALDDSMPTEAEADESWQNDLYDQACLLQERMTDATRQRFFAHLADGDYIVEQCLSLIMVMNKDQRAQFFAKYTELSATKAPVAPGPPPMRLTERAHD